MRQLPLTFLLLLVGCTAMPQQSAEETRVIVDSKYLLAEVALEDGRNEEAATLLLEAAELSPVEMYAERAAGIAEEQGLTEIGLRAVARWKELAPDDDRPTWFQAVFQTRAGLYDEAVANFSMVIDRVGGDNAGSALALIFETLAQEPDTATGTYVMRKLVEAYPGPAEGHYSLARLALRSGDFDLSLEHARRAVELDPMWLDAELLLARALLVSGQTEESLALVASLAEENPMPEVQLQRAELLLSAGRGDEAEALLTELLRTNPGMVDAIRALAFLRLGQDELDEAAQHFDELRANPNYRNEAFYYLGRIAETKGDLLQATRSYARVTEGTHVVEAQLRIARIMFDQTGDPAAALRHLEQFGSENPPFASDMLVARSQILMQVGRSHDALALIGDALRESPNDSSLQNAHVQIFVSMSQEASDGGDLAGAEKVLLDGLKLYPKDVSLRYSQSLLYENQGKMRRAMGILEDLVAEQPNNPALLNAFGYLLTDQFDRHSEAEGYIRRALAMDPDNPAIIDSMGWVLFKLGDYPAALDYLERAYRLYNDPEVVAHLVDTRWMLGDHAAALELLEAGLKEFPDSRYLLEVNKRIAQQ
jgi:tetratricopeptide (TPR) repeat protein